MKIELDLTKDEKIYFEQIIKQLEFEINNAIIHCEPGAESLIKKLIKNDLNINKDILNNL